jgi:hypothetical protein
MKISNLIEQLFAQAVALDQRAGMRSVIYLIGNEIYIMNYDHTLLLRFKLRKNEGFFDQALSFYANDYDSNVFEEKDGKIIFHTEQDGYARKKICGVTQTPPEEVRKLFKKYYSIKKKSKSIETELSEDLLKSIEGDLSHIEFSGKKSKGIKLVQRNIYSGAVIVIEKSSKGMFKENLPYNFGPVAIKTNDLLALFAFDEKTLKFTFPLEKGNDYMIIETLRKSKRDMVGIVSRCLYDEVITIEESKKIEDGNKKIKRKK